MALSNVSVDPVVDIHEEIGYLAGRIEGPHLSDRNQQGLFLKNDHKLPSISALLS